VSRFRAAAPGPYRKSDAPYVGKELDEAPTLPRAPDYLHVDFLKPKTTWPWLKRPAAAADRLLRHPGGGVRRDLREPVQGRPGGKHPRGAGKPIGSDLESSRKVNDAVAQFFPENRTYRIDHYLGKETVQNLIALRFANSLFETQWNQNYISHVEITVAEKVGIEGRWGYFDKAGQLRDMIQNHLLQLLCLIAMDPPADLSADSIRDEKVKVLKALAPISPEGLTTQVVRGQYIAGYSEGKPVPGYLEEETQSDTETFVALRRYPQLALGRRAVLPAYRQAHAAEAVADRHPLQGTVALHLRPGTAPADQQQADHPPATGRRHFLAGDDQGTGPGQGHATAQRPAATEFFRHLAQRGSRMPTSGCCWK
jgi:hypothetical protein